MSKYYGQEFRVYPASVYPAKAHTWDTLEEVKSEYQEFILECDKWGNTPLEHWVYLGEPEGDEERYGYPDFPDYILSPGKRGGVKIKRI